VEEGRRVEGTCTRAESRRQASLLWSRRRGGGGHRGKRDESDGQRSTRLSHALTFSSEALREGRRGGG
jgi:hypothetical protein